MAITSTITDKLADSQKPSAGHTPASFTALSSPQKAGFVYELAASGVENADPDTAFTAIASATKTYLDGTHLPSTMKLDTTQTITAVYTIESIIRVNDVGTSQGDMYKVGVDEFHVRVKIEWE